MSEDPFLYRKRRNRPPTVACCGEWDSASSFAPTGLDGKGTATETAVVDSGRSGLVQVFGDRNWSIYELPKATPLLTPAARRR
jgi:hypothetical protein